MHPHNPLQPHQHGGPLSGLCDQLDGIRDDGGVPITSAVHQALPDVRIQQHPPLSPILSIHPEPPGWKRLITSPLPKDEQISLITMIFSNRDEVKMIRHLCGHDAQILIDVMYEVYIFACSKDQVH